VRDPLPRALGLGLVVLTASACGPAPRQPPEHGIDAIFAEYDRDDSPGCAVGVIREGAFVFRKGYGMASLELGVPNTTKTVFYVGSVSKQLVAASVALAARQGHLSLDDDIREHLPEMPDYGAPITVRHLIHHTSGLRDYLALMHMAGMRYEDVHTDGELVALVARQKALNFPPGEEHLYSNSGYFLLSEIVERATGQSLREFARENIFGPLGMTHTHFHDDRTEVVPGRAMAYEADDEGGFRLLWYLNFDKVGSGGLLTSVEDLLLWDRAFYSDPLGGGGFVEQLLERGVLNDGTTLDYAFALEHGEHRGLWTIAHAGAFMGFRAQLLRFPDERVSVVALCNVAGAEPDRLAREVADIVLADRVGAPTPPEPGSGDEELAGDEAFVPSTETLEGYAGRYFSDELQATYTLSVADGALTLQRGRLDSVVLEPVAEGELRADGLRVVFRDGERGRAATLTVHAGRVRDVRFVRVAD
jgi:CubicO group peptidase (beta-lactamase class C family)